jgi:peptidyl-prolyl cis-trans isomerase C
VGNLKKTLSVKIKAQHFILLAALLALGACRWGWSKAPTGQVVATVGAREITLRQLHAELEGFAPATPEAQRAGQRAALNRILERSILADAAKKQGLDKDPDFILLSERANDALLVEMLQKKILASVPPPTTEEASQFEDAHPNIFAERKIFDVEQIRILRPTDPSVLSPLRPLNTLDEVVAYLTKHQISFQRGTSSIDAVGLSPKAVDAIVALPPQEVFIIPAGNMVLINRITNTRTEPFTGDKATKYALYLLRTQHATEVVQKAFTNILISAKGQIRYNRDFQAPPKTARFQNRELKKM